jgi:hypothetical protein
MAFIQSQAAGDDAATWGEVQTLFTLVLPFNPRRGG